MSPKPLILLTNDDGIEAPGLEALYEAIAPWARTAIVAPARERSGVSHAITVLEDMAYRQIFRQGRLWGHALDGMPADCVKLAVTRLLNEPPDLVIAGINAGANIGNNILYSGTVAAAREAAMFGLPALAVSVQGRPFPPGAHRFHYETAGRAAAQLAPLVIERGLPRGVILNVNVPNLPPEDVGDLVVSRQGATMYLDNLEPTRVDGRIQSFRNVGDQALRSDPDEHDCDDVVLENACISVTPLRFDMTDDGLRAELEAWLTNPILAKAEGDDA